MGVFDKDKEEAHPTGAWDLEQKAVVKAVEQARERGELRLYARQPVSSSLG